MFRKYVAKFVFILFFSQLASAQEYSGRLVEWVPISNSYFNLSAGIGKNNSVVVFFQPNALSQKYGQNILVKFLMLRQDYGAYLMQDYFRKNNQINYGLFSLPNGKVIPSIPLTLISEADMYSHPLLGQDGFDKLNCVAYKLLSSDEQEEFKRKTLFFGSFGFYEMEPLRRNVDAKLILATVTSVQCANIRIDLPQRRN